MKEQQLTPNENIHLVVNGGSTILDSATVSIEWHFSKELIAKKPEYVVICDHETPLSNLKETGNTYYGNRYLCKITDLVKYVQLFRPGKHHFVILVFSGDDAKLYARFYIRKGSSHYENGIFYSNLLQKKDDRDTDITYFEFDVPEELFAKKSETKFGTFIWNYVNEWHSKKPIDQCEYRKRKIFAFTIKPLLLLAFWILVSVIGTIYTLIGCFVVLFLGYRPVSAWKNIVFAVKMSVEEFQSDLRYHENWGDCRLWKSRHDDGGPTYIQLLLVPWILLLSIGIMFGIGSLVIHFFSSLLSAVPVIIIGLLIFISLLVSIRWYISDENKEKRREKNKQKGRERKIEKEKLEKEEDERMLNFLTTHASLISASEKVNIQRIIPVVDGVTRFTIRFWNLKAKVCKPFAK